MAGWPRSQRGRSSGAVALQVPLKQQSSGCFTRAPPRLRKGRGGRGVCWRERHEPGGWSARAVPIESGNPEGEMCLATGDGPTVKPSERVGCDGSLAKLNQGSRLLRRSHGDAQTQGKVEI